MAMRAFRMKPSSMANAARITSGMVMTAGLSCGWRGVVSGVFEMRGELPGSSWLDAASAIAAGEDVVDLPGHVEGGERVRRSRPCRTGACEMLQLCAAWRMASLHQKPEKKREAAEREHAGGVGEEGDGHGFLQSAHAADVLLAGAAMDDGAGAEEEQRLEEGVGDEVEHADGDAADAEAHHHVAELRNGGVGEDALDVVLRDGDQRGEEGGDRADPGDDLQGDGGV